MWSRVQTPGLNGTKNIRLNCRGPALDVSLRPIRFPANERQEVLHCHHVRNIDVADSPHDFDGSRWIRFTNSVNL